jgi:hypothetical protein
LLWTNLLIDHAKHLNLNFKISLAKYFTFLLLTSHHLLIMGLRHNLLSINEIKVLDHGTNLYHFHQATGPAVITDLNQVQCVVGQIFDQGKWAEVLQ